MGTPISVGLGEIAVSKKAGDVLVSYGLGSCVAVCMFDLSGKICGLLHAVLPEGAERIGDKTKFVDSGTAELLSEMEKAGARRDHLVVYLVGGANMITSPGFSKSFDIGTRNIDAAHRTLKSLVLPLKGEDVGGHVGRTVHLFIDTGQLIVRMIGGKETILSN
jgi:chemotaxis protein CheD